MPKIVMYLMNKKGLETLSCIVMKYTTEVIEYVVLAKDSAVENDYYSEIVEFCISNDINYFDRGEHPLKHSGYKFAIGWRWIILDVDRLIVLHDSILPRYRGFAPLVNMLINGEKEIGVTALFANESYDKGAIIKQEKIEIEYPIKIARAIEMISKLYQKVICEIVEMIIKKIPIDGVVQDEGEATYSIWRNEDDYIIDWCENADLIKRTVDALGFPYGGARSKVGNETVIIDDVEIVNDVIIEIRHPGKIIFFKDGCPVIICGKGLITLKKMSIVGKDDSTLEIKLRTKLGNHKF